MPKSSDQVKGVPISARKMFGGPGLNPGAGAKLLATMPTLFTRIMQGEIPADIVYEDDYVVACRDIQPQAPVHVLIVTRAEIPGVAFVPDEGDHRHLLNAARVIAEQLGLAETGYRLVVNQGSDAGQTVDHLHMHLLGGAPLGHFGVAG